MTTSLPSSALASGAACCDDFTRASQVSRRGFMRGGLVAAGATTMIGSAVVTASPAQAAEADSVLVVLSMRGAADGLSLVVPHSDPAYYAARPGIAVPKSRLLMADGSFGLHPELAPLLPMWRAGEVAAVHGTGLHAPNRSHFAAMEEVEDADPGSSKRQGWLNRLLGQIPGSSPLQGFGQGGGVLPAAMAGSNPVMSARDVENVWFSGDDEWDEGGRMRSLHTLWDQKGGPMGSGMRAAFAAVDGFQPVRRTEDRTGSYPATDLGRAMAQVARVIRGNIGTRVITVDQGDWDMHVDLGNLEWGAMKRGAAELAGSIAAFFNDLGDQRRKVTLVTLSEFGRRVQENHSGGLDHGYGNVMFLAGAGVRGGRYYGQVMPLTNQIDSDVMVTTDYRSVLSEVVTSRFDVSRASVFPGFQPESVGAMTSL